MGSLRSGKLAQQYWTGVGEVPSLDIDDREADLVATWLRSSEQEPVENVERHRFGFHSRHSRSSGFVSHCIFVVNVDQEIAYLAIRYFITIAVPRLAPDGQ